MAENELVQVNVSVNEYMSINITFRKQMSLLDFVGTMRNASNLLKLSKDMVQTPEVSGYKVNDTQKRRNTKVGRHDWTSEEDQIIIENFGKISTKEIMNLLGNLDNLNINKIKVRAYFLRNNSVKPVDKRVSRYRPTNKSISSIKNDTINIIYKDLLAGIQAKEIARKRKLALHTVYNTTSKLRTEGYITEA